MTKATIIYVLYIFNNTSVKVSSSVNRRMLVALVLGILGSVSASQPTYQEYTVYKELEEQLLYGENGSFNVFSLAETFYPKVGQGPICVPILYTLICPNVSSDGFSIDTINCTDFGFNSSFLWTQYDLNAPIGPLLLSYAWNGVAMKGFNWENSCDFFQDIHILLNVDNITSRNEVVLRKALQALTAVAKFYAKNQGNKGSLGDSGTKGYAIPWNDKDKKARVFNTSQYILMAVTVAINIFVYFLIMAMSSYSYKNLYINIKKKKNPGYPLFWSVVLLTFFWNIGPSWLILSQDSNLIYYSLAVMIPLELLMAIIVKKRSDFPIPCMSTKGCLCHPDYHYSWECAIIFRCLACLISHLVQVMAIWSIMVFITFLAYYFSFIIIAFYLYPTQTLVKVVFLKAVAVCAVINVALLFSNSKFWCKCSWKSFKHDIRYVMVVLSIFFFLPILGFLVYIIGGILFATSTQSTGLQSVLTLLPSLFLVYAAWFTKGRLFPKGVSGSDPGEEIFSDMEKGGTKESKQQSDTPVSLNSSKNGELSSYNSLDSRTLVDDGVKKERTVEERKPLLY